MTTTASKPQEKRSGIRYGGAISFRGKNVTTVSDLVNHLFLSGLSRHYCPCNSTSRYENRVSKQLSLCNRLFTVLFAYVVFFFFAWFVVRDLCRSGCRQNYHLIPPTHNSLFNTRDSYLKSVFAKSCFRCH